MQFASSRKRPPPVLASRPRTTSISRLRRRPATFTTPAPRRCAVRNVLRPRILSARSWMICPDWNGARSQTNHAKPRQRQLCAAPMARSAQRALANLTGLSERHLRRRFLDSVGATPKTYGRQLRLTAAAQAAEQLCTPELGPHRRSDRLSRSGAHDQRISVSALDDAAIAAPRTPRLVVHGLSVRFFQYTLHLPRIRLNPTRHVVTFRSLL